MLESLSEIQKMESSVLQLKSLSDSWMILSSIFIEMDVIFGVMCGVGLFFLLIPFLKTYPVSPPPESGKNTPKVRKALAETQWSVFSLLFTTVRFTFPTQVERQVRGNLQKEQHLICRDWKVGQRGERP